MAKVYIAGPMTGLPDHNFAAFFRAAELVRQQGHEPVNPADGAPMGKSWEWYMRRAIKLMLDANEVWLLEGWSNSNGAFLEWQIANRLGMPMRYLSADGAELREVPA